MPMMDNGYAGYDESQRYFHSDNTFIGRAYNMARAEGRAIDWNDIIDSYDLLFGADSRHVKTIMKY